MAQVPDGITATILNALINSSMNHNNQLAVTWQAFSMAGVPTFYPSDQQLIQILITSGFPPDDAHAKVAAWSQATRTLTRSVVR